MEFITTSSNTISQILSIVESFKPKEQKDLLKALERKRLMDKAITLSKSLKKAPKVSMLEIVNEINQVRKENGYKAYSI